ncbi:acyltransferase family protein [Thiosulfatimonas sediminis]|nr:acyltransferase [Thiosulfatimonas sediminis]
MNKVHSIQLLRGVASLLVLIVHAFYKEEVYGEGQLGRFLYGNIGVDIFFIISGFVMLYTLNSNKSASQFLIKRAIRILPVYWATLSIVIVVYLLFPSMVNGGRESSVVGSIFLIPMDALFLNQNAWTLTFEFIFYFVFATVFIFNGQFRVWGVVVILIALVIIGQIYTFDLALLRALTSSLLIEFLYGFVLYAFFMKFNDAQKIALILILFLAVFLLQFVEVPSEYRMISLGIPALFICTIVVYLEKYIARFFWRISDFFGDISYSLYLVHPMTLFASAVVLSYLGISDPFIFLLALLITSIFAGWFTFTYIEQPLTKKLQITYSEYRKR